MQHSPPGSGWQYGGDAIAGNQERLGDKRSDTETRLARWRNVESFQSRVGANRFRRWAVGDLPLDFSLIEIDRGDSSIRRFDQRKTTNRGGNTNHRRGWLRSGRCHDAVFVRRSQCQGIRSSSRARSCPSSHRRLTGYSPHVAHVPVTRWHRHNSYRNYAGRARRYIQYVAFRIVRPPRPVCSAVIGSQGKRGQWALRLAQRRRCKNRADLVALD